MTFILERAVRDWWNTFCHRDIWTFRNANHSNTTKGNGTGTDSVYKAIGGWKTRPNLPELQKQDKSIHAQYRIRDANTVSHASRRSRGDRGLREPNKSRATTSTAAPTRRMHAVRPNRSRGTNLWQPGFAEGTAWEQQNSADRDRETQQVWAVKAQVKGSGGYIRASSRIVELRWIPDNSHDKSMKENGEGSSGYNTEQGKWSGARSEITLANGSKQNTVRKFTEETRLGRVLCTMQPLF